MEGLSLRPGGAGGLMSFRPGGGGGASLLSAFAAGSRSTASTAVGKEEKSHDEVIKYDRNFLLSLKEARKPVPPAGLLCCLCRHPPT